MGGATATSGFQTLHRWISIHAPRGGSDLCRSSMAARPRISIHAPRGGSDTKVGKNGVVKVQFQSTLPVGGATLLWGLSPPHPLISIHAPRGGSDTLAVTGWKVSPDFNPRSPWGERLFIPHSSFCRIKFQSTLPVGGATFDFGAFSVFFPISIHAPRGGSDRK